MTELPSGFQLDDLPEGFAPDRLNPMMPPNMGPKPPAPTMLQRFGQAAMPEGPGESVLNMASSFPATAAGGYAGMAGALLPGPEGQGRDWSQAVQNMLTYQPRKPSGENIAKVLGLPGEGLAWVGNKFGEPIASGSESPALGAAANAAMQVGPSLLLPVGVKKARAAMQEAKAGRAAEAMFDESQPAPVMEGPGYFEQKARDLMQRAIKPTARDLNTGRADRAITTALEQGVNPTRGNMEAVSKQIDILDKQLDAAIAESGATVQGHRGPLVEMAALIKDLKRQVNPNADVHAAYKALNEFVNNPLVSEYMPIQTAQAIKQGTYRALGDKAYGELKGAEIESQKTLARGLNQEISAASPEAAAINKPLGDLINLRDVMEPRVRMAGNKNLLGLGSLSPSALNALVWLADRSPWALGMAARGLYNTPRAAAGAVTAGQYGTLPAVAQESSETAAGK